LGGRHRRCNRSPASRRSGGRTGAEGRDGRHRSDRRCARPQQGMSLNYRRRWRLSQSGSTRPRGNPRLLREGWRADRHRPAGARCGHAPAPGPRRSRGTPQMSEACASCTVPRCPSNRQRPATMTSTAAGSFPRTPAPRHGAPRGVSGLSGRLGATRGAPRTSARAASRGACAAHAGSGRTCLR
jgi:hypothetical protein